MLSLFHGHKQNFPGASKNISPGIIKFFRREIFRLGDVWQFCLGFQLDDGFCSPFFTDTSKKFPARESWKPVLTFRGQGFVSLKKGEQFLPSSPLVPLSAYLRSATCSPSALPQENTGPQERALLFLEWVSSTFGMLHMKSHILEKKIPGAGRPETRARNRGVFSSTYPYAGPSILGTGFEMDRTCPRSSYTFRGAGFFSRK